MTRAPRDLSPTARAARRQLEAELDPVLPDEAPARPRERSRRWYERARFWPVVTGQVQDLAVQLVELELADGCVLERRQVGAVRVPIPRATWWSRARWWLSYRWAVRRRWYRPAGSSWWTRRRKAAPAVAPSSWRGWRQLQLEARGQLEAGA